MAGVARAYTTFAVGILILRTHYAIRDNDDQMSAEASVGDFEEDISNFHEDMTEGAGSVVSQAATADWKSAEFCCYTAREGMDENGIERTGEWTWAKRIFKSNLKLGTAKECSVITLANCPDKPPENLEADVTAIQKRNMESLPKFYVFVQEQFDTQIDETRKEHMPTFRTALQSCVTTAKEAQKASVKAAKDKHDTDVEEATKKQKQLEKWANALSTAPVDLPAEAANHFDWGKVSRGKAIYDETISKITQAANGVAAVWSGKKEEHQITLEKKLAQPLADWLEDEKKKAVSALKAVVLPWLKENTVTAEKMQEVPPVPDVPVAENLEADNWKGYNEAVDKLTTECKTAATDAKAAYEKAMQPKRDAKANILKSYADAYGGEEKMDRAVDAYRTKQGRCSSGKGCCCKVKTNDGGALIPSSGQAKDIQPIRVPDNFDMSDCIDVTSYAGKKGWSRCDLFDPTNCGVCRTTLCGAATGKLLKKQKVVCDDKANQASTG